MFSISDDALLVREKRQNIHQKNKIRKGWISRLHLYLITLG